MKATNVSMLLLLILMTFFAVNVSAQVTIGSGKVPENYSILELDNQNKELGLRLPQITDRDALSAKLMENDKAKGLQIFNMHTGCVETWNGTTWIALCPPPTECEPTTEPDTE